MTSSDPGFSGKPFLERADIIGGRRCIATHEGLRCELRVGHPGYHECAPWRWLDGLPLHRVPDDDRLVARCSAVAPDRAVQCDLPDGHADGHRGEDSFGWFGWFDAHSDGTPTSSMSVRMGDAQAQDRGPDWVEEVAYDRLQARLGDTEEALDEAIRQRDAARAELAEAVDLVHQSKDDERRAAQRVAQAEARWHRAVGALRDHRGELRRMEVELKRVRSAADTLADAIERRSLYGGGGDHPIDRYLWNVAVWYRTFRDHFDIGDDNDGWRECGLRLEDATCRQPMGHDGPHMAQP